MQVLAQREEDKDEYKDEDKEQTKINMMCGSII
jgi:hypothetical protein